MNKSPELDPNTHEVQAHLSEVLAQHKNLRVVVVGPTCCGKSTLAERIPGAVDMDKVLFPLLSDEEVAYVCQKPWTPEIGRTMVGLARERLQIEPGRPVFGTMVLDADVIIYLRASDELLATRAAKRGANLRDVLGMKQQIEDSVANCSLPVVEIGLE